MDLDEKPSPIATRQRLCEPEREPVVGSAASAIAGIAHDDRESQEVIALLRHAQALMAARGKSALPWATAIAHVDAAIHELHLDLTDQTDQHEPPEEARRRMRSSCEQETQTFQCPCHSTGTQANPQMSSASTGTGPRPAALGARMQENRS